MLNTTQAAALHAFNNSASQGRLTETSLARALKSEKVVARNTINALREKGMVTPAGKYEFRITDAGKKHLKTIASNVSATLKRALPGAKTTGLANSATQPTEELTTKVLQCVASSSASKTVTKIVSELNEDFSMVRAALHQLATGGLITQYENGTFYAMKAGRERAAEIAKSVSVEPEADTANQAEETLSESQEQRPDQQAATAKQEAETASDNADDEAVNIDDDLAALEEQGLIKCEGEALMLSEPQSAKAHLDAELSNLAELLDPDQFPVIDDIDHKQHALSGIALLLKPRTPALANLAEQLATDLSVIRLHQERRD